MAKPSRIKGGEPRRKTRQPPAFGVGAGRGGSQVRAWARSKQGRKGGNR